MDRAPCRSVKEGELMTPERPFRTHAEAVAYYRVEVERQREKVKKEYEKLRDLEELLLHNIKMQRLYESEKPAATRK